MILAPTRCRRQTPAERIRLHVSLNLAGLSPRRVRQHFTIELRDSIARAAMAGRLDIAIAEELWRTLPLPEVA
jgi:hypothetical protein